MDRHVFIARQPILDRRRRVVAYELLFRPTVAAEAAAPLSEQASARVITDVVLSFGLTTLTRGKPAFINTTRRLLVDGLVELESILPPSQVVIELLEQIEADDEVLAACRRLKRAGYALALDDFVLNDGTAALVPLADYIKVDWLAPADPDLRRRVAQLCAGAGPAFLAEKVETIEQFDAAMAEGYSFFQGFFFGRPATHCGREIPGNQAGQLRLLQALQDEELTVHKLERLIEHDASLCYRLLRTVNSAGFGQATSVTSIRQTLILMGVAVVRRWVSLWVLAGISDGAHPELLVLSTIRARCCELLAPQTPGGDVASEGFLLGMCSLLDAILDRPMSLVVTQLPLSSTMQAALLGEDTRWRRVLDCAIAYERGEWNSGVALAQRAGLAPEALVAAHGEALRWSAEFLQSS